MPKSNGKAHSFYDSSPDTPTSDEIQQDPLAERKTHFTMKVNAYEMELMDRCAQVQRVSKAALLRYLLDEYAKEKGIF